MNKSGKYLLITTFFFFLFCSGCLQQLSGGYQPIGMENWLRKHIDSETADGYDQNKESIESKRIKRYLDSLDSLEKFKDSLREKRLVLEYITACVDQQLDEDVENIVFKSRSKKLTLRVYEVVQTFNEEYLPHLKNRNLSEKEISPLRFQYVCEWIARDVKVIEQALKLKQEQEQEARREGRCYQCIGLENWLRENVKSEQAEKIIKGLSEGFASINSKHVEASIKEIKNHINVARESLEILEKTRNPNLGELKVDVGVAKAFDTGVYPILKNQNLNEEEISCLRLQYICEIVAFEIKMFEKILKAKQEQEGIN